MAQILLVEDNELNRDMLSRRLRRRGHEVKIAVDGADGWLFGKVLGYPQAIDWERIRP